MAPSLLQWHIAHVESIVSLLVMFQLHSYVNGRVALTCSLSPLIVVA